MALPCIAPRNGTDRNMATYKKKPLEMALPLDAINWAPAREQSIRQGAEL